MIRRTLYNKPVVILREAVKRRPKNLARLPKRKDHVRDSSLPMVAQNDNGKVGCVEWHADFSAFSFLKTNLDPFELTRV
jgi:hypothetical protein